MLSIRFLVVFSLLVSISLLQGCATPKAYRVRSGNEPRYQDDDVRFRTTYYYRVLNLCGKKTNASVENTHPKVEGLYRFRMSGKANPLFNEIHFESGLVKREQIEPFGRAVQYDSQTNHYKIGSATAPPKEPRPSEDSNDKNCRQWHVLGPEGWRLAASADLLVMAMSSDSQPLVQQLKKISGLREQASNTLTPAQLTLKLSTESITTKTALTAVKAIDVSKKAEFVRQIQSALASILGAQDEQ